MITASNCMVKVEYILASFPGPGNEAKYIYIYIYHCKNKVVIIAK